MQSTDFFSLFVSILNKKQVVHDDQQRLWRIRRTNSISLLFQALFDVVLECAWAQGWWRWRKTWSGRQWAYNTRRSAYSLIHVEAARAVVGGCWSATFSISLAPVAEPKEWARTSQCSMREHILVTVVVVNPTKYARTSRCFYIQSKVYTSHTQQYVISRSTSSIQLQLGIAVVV